MDISRVRRFVIDLLPELGLAPTQPNWETLLVSDGKPLGCRFEFDHVRAYWFATRQAVEFYGADWSPLKVAQLG
ncbi:MAG TPA: hypothetical protein VFI31_01445 [Pirellulales bacterium]|nr:hypothetical protein [Pirellulales bacterium]